MNTPARSLPGAWARVPARARIDVPAAAVEPSATSDTVLLALLLACVLSFALEGVLRYALAVGGAPNLIYLRDAIAALSIVFLFLRTLFAQGRVDFGIAIPVAVLVAHAAYAAVAGVAFFSIGFGLKVLMYVLYGIAMWPLLAARFPRVLAIASVLFALTAAGVFANYFLERMPWEGFEYETAFGTAESTRVWWAAKGVARLPGFTRSSFNAAMMLGITGVLMLVRFRAPAARLAIIAAALAAIALTTSKGMFLAFPIAAGWLVLQAWRARLRGVVLVAAMCLGAILLPFVVVYLASDAPLRLSSFPALIGSVWDRFTTMWPGAFDLLPDGPLALLGGGPGSIGMPQLYGDAPHRFNAADSIAVYVTVVFGLPGLVYLALPAAAVHRIATALPADVHRACVAVLVLAYGYGLSINMFEESFFSIAFGACCGAALAALRDRTGEAR